MVRSKTRSLGVACVVSLVLAAGSACSHQTAPTPGSPTSSTSAQQSTGGSAPLPSGSSSTPSGPVRPAGTAKPGGASTAGPPPVTTPVPPPTPGTVNETVAQRPEVTKKPVKLEQASSPSRGVRVRITHVQTLNAKAQIPGEVAGPGVAFTILVDNGTTRALDVGSVVVTLTDDRGNPGSEMSAKPAKPLRGKLAPGASRKGVYVFTVDKGRRDPLSVNVTLAGATPVLVFKGPVR